MLGILKLTTGGLLVTAIFTAGWLGYQPDNSVDSDTPPLQEKALHQEKGNPQELGRVRWRRGLDQAKADSKKTGKPIFVLFQEVPGCVTCRNFGDTPLSHPLMVEAIEENFIPVVVYNNKPVDTAILKEFGERSWNNPVVRFINSDGKDLVPKREGVWTIAGISARMIQSLKNAKRTVPSYLELVAKSKSRESKVATFAMHCYWEGEAQFGKLAGVQSTVSGWKAGKEVVQIAYDPNKIKYSELVKQAKAFRCASTIFAHSDDQSKVANAIVPGRVADAKSSGRATRAKDSDQKYYLRKSFYRYLPLTELQAVKVNSGLRFGMSKKEIEGNLSPRQIQMVRKIEQIHKQDRKKLAGLMYPQSDQDLVRYQDRLLKAIL